jgi:D-Tyr-tRNAtyr deacylase
VAKLSLLKHRVASLTLQVAMNDTLCVEIRKAFEYLCDVSSYETLWKLAKLLERLLQRSILNESARKAKLATRKSSEQVEQGKVTLG